MLSIANVKSADDAVAYFEKDNYYTKDAPGALEACHWHGKGTQKLGLEGYVELDTFGKVLSGELPNGELLGRIEKGERVHRPGLDLTFSAPKSASLLIEINKSQDVKAAHMKAVKDTLDYIEKNLVYTRKKVGKEIVYEKVDNITAALFLHDTSRENDPQTHTHCVIANAVKREDGSWRSISTESIYQHKMLLGMMYRDIFARELMQQGYEIEKTSVDGRFEIKGFSDDQLDHFSKRRQQIEAELQKQGYSSAKASAVVARETRAAKKSQDRELLHQSWTQAAEDIGIDFGAITEQATLSNKPYTRCTHQEIEQSLLNAATDLNQYQATFLKHDILRFTMASSVGRVSIEEAEAALNRVVGNGQLIKLGETRFTTPEYLEIEKNNLERLKQGHNSVFAINQSFQLSPDKDYFTQGQKDAIGFILTTKDRITAIQGDAGTGKTTMLQEVKIQAEQAGFKVIGLSPKADAAKIMQTETGIKSDTLKSYLLRGKLNPHESQLLIIDEASTLSTRQVNELLKLAGNSPHVHIVFVGDEKQLNSIEAGNPLSLFYNNGIKTCSMTEVLRQKIERLKTAVDHAKEGNIEKAFEGVTVREESLQDKRLDKVVQDYISRSAPLRDKTMVLSSSNVDRQAINHRIRAALEEEGTLSGNTLKCRTLQSKDVSKEQSKQVAAYAVGDHIKMHQYDPINNLRKRHYYEIVAIDRSAGTFDVTSESGRRYTIKPDYHFKNTQPQVFAAIDKEIQAGDQIRWTSIVDKKADLVTSRTAKVESIENNQIKLRTEDNKLITVDQSNKQFMHFDYAYATTVYSAQGATANQVIANLDSKQMSLMSQSLFYVLMSRSKHDVTLYVDDQKACIKSISEKIGTKQNALDYLNNTQQVLPQSVQKSNDIAANSDQNAINSSFLEYEIWANQQELYSQNNTKIENKIPLDHNNNSYQEYNAMMSNIDQKVTRKPFKKWDLKELQSSASQQIKPLVESILGEPNARLSNENQMRYGSKGALVISKEYGKEGLWFDHSSGESGNIFSLVSRELGLSKKESFDYIGQRLGLEKSVINTQRIEPKISPKTQVLEQTESDLKSIRYAQRIAAQSRPIENTLAEKYLRVHRKIDAPELPKSMRFHPCLKEPETGKRFPALIVEATNKNKEIEAVQAIFLDPKTANKADINVAKRTYGRLKFGSTVSINDGKGKALIAEGPETALSLLSAFPNHPIEAVLSASNFKNIKNKPADGVILCCDNDGINSSSEKAVNKAESILKSEGLSVEKVKPNQKKYDFNDLHKAGGIAAIQSHFKDLKLNSNQGEKTLLDDKKSLSYESINL